jgi:hypothetical protein
VAFATGKFIFMMMHPGCLNPSQTSPSYAFQPSVWMVVARVTWP